MLIYEVNLTVEADAANAYSAWLKEHIRALLELDGFEAAAWYVRDADASTAARRGPADASTAARRGPDDASTAARRGPDDGPLGDRRWTLHYHLASRAHLDRYLDEDAERLRADGEERFEGRFTADRRVLEKKQVFSRTAEEAGEE